MVSSKNRAAIIKTLAGLSINLSAAWFSLVIITPNFRPITNLREVALLTIDLLLGIIFLLIAFELERELL